MYRDEFLAGAAGR